MIFVDLKYPWEGSSQVINWYHKQFKMAAKARYFVTNDEYLYFHSYMADYFLGGDRETMMR